MRLNVWYRPREIVKDIMDLDDMDGLSWIYPWYYKTSGSHGTFDIRVWTCRNTPEVDHHSLKDL